MKKTLPLDKGEIELSEDMLTIRDNAKRYKWKRILYSCIWIVYGVLSLLRYTKTGDQFLLWSGVIIGLGHAGAIVYKLFETTSSQIELHNIKIAVFKRRFGTSYLMLKLKSGSKRRINKIEPIEDDLRAFLDRKSIVTR
ncbi:hypothetical protein ACXYMU_05775 [Pontibacter sp. CAU 1760]